MFVWQQKALAERSVGICRMKDPDCNLQRSGPDSIAEEKDTGEIKQIISNKQAQSICETYVEKYFAKTRRVPHQRGADLNATIERVMAGCMQDVIGTGTIEVGKMSSDM